MQELQNQELKVLEDISKNGKKRKWRERKLKSIELAGRLKKLGYSSFERVYQCGEYLKFIEQTDGLKKLAQAYFCKNKLCPMCNWRRSMKYSYQAERVVTEALVRQPKGRFIFLTLTIKNVSGQDLNKVLSKLTEGFRRLMLYKKVDKNVLGYLRATEITYSKIRDDYHPHLHVLLFVKSSYFNSHVGYLNQKTWTELWQKAMKLDYIPVVDVRAVKTKKENTVEQSLKKAILETAKYPVKPFDIEEDKEGNKTFLTEEEKLKITDDMFIGLYRKRQIGFGKLFKEIKKDLAMDDIEDGNLVQTSKQEESSSTGKEVIAIWNWDRKNYFVK